MIPRRVHLVGIGGIGMSAIARVLIARGVQVTGSDLRATPLTDELAQLGARVFIDHRAENVGEVDLVLITSAAEADNPEIVAARRRGIRIAKRYDFFPELTSGKTTIAVAGTHGKTTTTGLIATILLDAGMDPDVIVGGIIPDLNGNAHAGKGKYFVIEADEYDRAFLGLDPKIAVITSIEMDHPDIYSNVDDVAQAFREFIARVPQDGSVIGNGDAERVDRELNRLDQKLVTRYGFGPTNDWRAGNVRLNSTGGSDFLLWRAGEQVGEFSVQIPGRHNVLNALAAIATADRVGIDLSSIGASLKSYRGAARRFQVKGEFGGVTVIDDYAHHPTEIRATLSAARARYPGRAVWAVFQPHTYSRTAALQSDFAQAFDDADHVIVTEIFPARERPVSGISGEGIIEKMKYPDARFIADLDSSVKFLAQHLRAGDVLITLGAGDVYRVGEAIVRLRQGE
ncbi:MAG TPA: UDP-N-acetylmuramate--L-alanine ligase [Anaerolineae bacterium]